MGPTPQSEAFLVLDNEDSFGFSKAGHRQLLFTESGPYRHPLDGSTPSNGCRVVPSVLRHGEGGFEGHEGS